MSQAANGQVRPKQIKRAKHIHLLCNDLDTTIDRLHGCLDLLEEFLQHIPDDKRARCFKALLHAGWINRKRAAGLAAEIRDLATRRGGKS
jgi:hypothetical protein